MPVGEDGRSRRVRADLLVRTETIDPVRDPVTGELCYLSSEDDRTLNLSHRGLCLRCSRPPEVGTRLFLEVQPPGQDRPIVVAACARWTSVHCVPGEWGGRVVADVGVEVLGGSRRALDNLDRLVDEIAEVAPVRLATPRRVG